MPVFEIRIGRVPIVEFGKSIRDPKPHFSPDENAHRLTQIDELEAVQRRVKAVPTSPLGQRVWGQDYSPEYKAELLAQADEMLQRGMQTRPSEPPPSLLSRARDFLTFKVDHPRPPVKDPNHERYMQELAQISSNRLGSPTVVFRAANKR